MNIKDLYQKVSGFEEGLSPEAKRLSQCRAGCSRCCYVDLSVFEIEAENLSEWFSALPIERKDELRNLWKASVTETTSFAGKKVSSCAFLINEQCSIYEARPLICRTQGLALKFKELEDTLVDICPLNEEMLGILSQNEMISLDLLNSILVQLDQLRSGDKRGERTSLSSLKAKFRQV